ncbi:MAG: ATP-binding protein [Acidobacteriota bacterium]|nr:ATP-binding protein [Acidobacteriota bacterium]
MARFFNTSGPCIPEDHYMVDIWERFDREELLQLIDNKRYFILHAPRQTGKTTMMRALAQRVTEAGRYLALYVNIETAQAAHNDVAQANMSILGEFERTAGIYLPQEFQPKRSHMDVVGPGNALSQFLTNWCLDLPKPLVLFLDEVDSLIGDSLISVLRQLRSGYNDRPRAFPQSVCCIGVRDIRDYRIYSDREKKHIVGGSAFNIKEKSLVLQNFNEKEVSTLYAAHTRETGQQFSVEACSAAYEQTGGQPWLVNALGREICFEKPPLAPNGTTVTTEHVEQAVRRLIKRRDVHLDQLADKLTEPRVARVIEAILIGSSSLAEANISGEDSQYVLDLGLARMGDHGLEIANPIYREVIPRELTATDEGFLGQNPSTYVTPEGKLDMEKLLTNLIEFYRVNHDMITSRKTYNEAAHHLVFLSWLHRIVNSGGYINREYAVGSGRMDLHIQFGGEHFAVELKLLKGKALEEGKDQLAGYLNRLNLKQGYLVLFRRGKITDPTNIGQRESITHQGKTIHVLKL